MLAQLYQHSQFKDDFVVFDKSRRKLVNLMRQRLIGDPERWLLIMKVKLIKMMERLKKSDTRDAYLK